MTDDRSAAAWAFDRQRAAMAAEVSTSPEKTVLLVLSIMANAEDKAWPPIRGPHGIAVKAKLGERTVARALRGLEAAGHITTREIPGKGSIYTVHPCRSGRPAVAAALPERQAIPAGAAGHPCHSGNQTTKEQPRTANRKKATPSPSTREPFPIPGGVDLSKWNDFAEMRRAMARGAKGRPWTPSVARKAIEKLAALADAGNDPGAVLDQSVLEGWQGLFPVKDNRNGQRTNRAGGSGGAGFARDRPVDGFTVALREIQARGSADHDPGG